MASTEKTQLNIIVKEYIERWYLAFCSISVCIFLAFIYLGNVLPEYRINVQVKINAQRHVSVIKADNIIEKVRSVYSILKAIDTLSLQVQYVQKLNFINKGLYGRQLPIKIIIDNQSISQDVAYLKVKKISGDLLEIKDNVGIATLHFNEWIDRPYARFKIIRGPAYLDKVATMISCYIYSPGFLADQYRQNLVGVAQAPENRRLTLSILETNPVQGLDLLNQLVNNYNIVTPRKNNENDLSRQHLRDSIKLINSELLFLKKRSSAIAEQAKNQHSVTKTKKTNKISGSDIQQLNIYNVIKPYLKTSADQFVLVPYADEIGNGSVRKSIDYYNSIQSLKQDKLRYLKKNDPAILVLNTKVSSLQQNILSAINQQEAIIKGTNEQVNLMTPPNFSLPTPNKLIDDEIKNKSQSLYLLSEKYNGLTTTKSDDISLTIIDKSFTNTPEYPKYWLTYFFALVVGLIIPVLVLYLMSYLKNAPDKHLTVINGDLKRKGIAFYYSSRDLISKFIENPPVYGQSQAILITSASEGGNLSFLKDLADKLAGRNYKTVIVDLNLREPDLLKSFGINSSAGVIDFLMNKNTDLKKLLLPSDEDKNIYLIGAGATNKNADPVLSFFNNNDLASPWDDENQLDKMVGSPGIGILVDRLKAEFRFILLNAPSISHPADLFPLVVFADKEIILISAISVKKQVKNITDMVQRKRFKNPVVSYFD